MSLFRAVNWIIAVSCNKASIQPCLKCQPVKHQRISLTNGFFVDKSSIRRVLQSPRAGIVIHHIAAYVVLTWGTVYLVPFDFLAQIIFKINETDPLFLLLIRLFDEFKEIIHIFCSGEHNPGAVGSASALSAPDPGIILYDLVAIRCPAGKQE